MIERKKEIDIWLGIDEGLGERDKVWISQESLIKEFTKFKK